jgi:HSP20 family protein
VAKKKEKKGRKKGTKQEKSEKLAVSETSRWYPGDIMHGLDEEFDAFRRSIGQALWWPRSSIGSSLLAWPEYYWPKLDWAETRQPLMDIKDTGKELVIEAEMPGISKENIDIQLTERSIEICGEVKTEEEGEEEGYYRQERSYSTCYRRIPLPAEVIPNKADARLEDGILHIKIPKKKPTSMEKSHSVKIK